MLNFFLL
ncbi:hypothetical protein D049_1980A, partial [Vibrio parahaemolyticus VPTS-2010]